MPTKARLLFASPVAGSSKNPTSTSAATISMPPTQPSAAHPLAETSANTLDNSEYERLSETITKLQSIATPPPPPLIRKTVAFSKLPGDANSSSSNSNKSRYKSEPNLSRIVCDQKLNLQTHDQRNLADNGRYISNKLLKGVSMSNLASDLYATPANVKRNFGDDEDLDDPDFEATPNSRDSSYVYDDDDLMHVVDITPVNKFLVGRRSMSPITKSTQRMSKAMQVCNAQNRHFFFTNVSEKNKIHL